MKKEKSQKTKQSQNKEEKINIENKSEETHNTTHKKLLVKKDYIYIAIITIVYSIVSFINLGSFTNPQTFWVTEQNKESVIFQLPDNQSLSKIRYYTGNKTGKCTISFSEDNVNYVNSTELETKSVYHWYDFKNVQQSKYIKITEDSKGTYLGEVGFYDENDNLITPTPINETAKLLCDEQNVVPEEITYLNSSYFDEVYFPRTAYEHLHNLDPYEWTHPPLGKIIIAIPIAFFGMTPFAYRLLGNVAGILMIPAMYVLGKMLFKKSKYGVLAALIMALDGMHFVQTRIGTTDSFLVLFIILEYLFMYKYILNEGLRLRKRLIPLFLSGLFMGMSISIKWSGVFSAIGLAIIFFASLIIEIVKKKKWTKENTIIILSCIIFFIVIPVLIYLLSYIPFYVLENPKFTDVQGFFNWQKKMFNYHNDLNATHSYTSKWYTWPITQKSVLYWTSKTNNGELSRIALLGNPIIFWFSIPCMLFTLIMAIRKRKFNYWFLIIAILSSILPYLKIRRIMFLYHYFPILPFAMLSIVAFLSWLCDKKKSNAPIYGFLLVTLVVFILFFPVYSGLPTTVNYLQRLKWLKTWVW